MFNSKKTQLFETPVKEKVAQPESKNPFVQAGLRKTAEVSSGNGSLKYNTTGDPFVDQFGTVSQYKAPRPYADVDKDMRNLWSIDPRLTMCLLFFIRMITRVVSLFDGTKTENIQKGSGLKHEGITRMLWIAINHPDTFWKNLDLFIAIGSWKDIIQMLSYDLQYNGWKDRKLDWDSFGNVLIMGLSNPNQVNLIKKYLPQIKSRSKCTTIESQADTMIAKWICSLLFGEGEKGSKYKRYRKLKTSGTAHQWQQLISQKKFDEINFDSIHGRALMKLASSKFLKNQGLEAKYSEWIAKKPVAKFTGFVYELAEQVTGNLAKYQKDTVNAQYAKLLELAAVNTENSPYRPIAVVDGSASMNSPMYIGNGKVGKMSSWKVAFPLAIFLDDMLTNSPFKDHYLQFSSKCEMIRIRGNSFVDKILMTDRGHSGGTNFMSIFALFIDIKIKNPGLTEEQFPNMIVCFSDGEFNTVGRYVTNIEEGRRALVGAGFSKEFTDSFGFCFVDMPNTFYHVARQPKFETFGNVKNCFYFSGYDLSPLGFLFGQSKVTDRVPTTASELFKVAMEQDVMKMIEI
jgi:hypothetical protein